jgi:hypothetical protein
MNNLELQDCLDRIAELTLALDDAQKSYMTAASASIKAHAAVQSLPDDEEEDIQDLLHKTLAADAAAHEIAATHLQTLESIQDNLLKAKKAKDLALDLHPAQS